MAETIRVLFVDDHPVVREGLRALITADPALSLVGEASDGLEAVAQARALRPDVIVLDMVMPRQDGLNAIRQIMEELPEMRILVLTGFDEDRMVFSAIKAGAVGYILKDSSPQELLRAIKNVHQGEASLHPMIARKLIREVGRQSEIGPVEQPLTGREIDVLTLVAQGFSNREIAEKLQISERTARTHVGNILDKLNLSNRTRAALYALRTGLVSLDHL